MNVDGTPKKLDVAGRFRFQPSLSKESSRYLLVQQTVYVTKIAVHPVYGNLIKNTDE